MGEVEKLREAVPMPEKPKIKYLRGEANTAWGLRMLFSIDESHVRARSKVLDLLLDEFATLFNIAAVDETMAINLLSEIRQMNEAFLSRFYEVAQPSEDTSAVESPEMT